MIIYGSRMYGRKNEVRGYGVCAECGHYGSHKSYDGRKWGHIYFIPLFPMGGHVRVLRECGKCGMGVHMPIDAANAIYGNIETTLPHVLAATAEGRHTFTMPETEEVAHTGPIVADTIELLHVTGHGAEIPGILEMLEQDGAEYEFQIARSACHDVQGRADPAETATQRAREALPDAPYPHVMLARFAGRRGDAQRQLQHFETASAMLGGKDVNILLEMIGPLEILKRYDEVTELLDRCIALVPELAEDKKFMKAPQKVRQEGGEDGEVIGPRGGRGASLFYLSLPAFGAGLKSASDSL